MTTQRFAVFTYGHGDTVFTTRFRFVARCAVRLVKTLDCLPEGMARGTDAAAGLCGPECPHAGPRRRDEHDLTKTPTGWACTCGEADCVHVANAEATATDEEDQGRYGGACPDCGHDYYHDPQGRCMYPLSGGYEARVCGWHPDVMGPVPCESRIEG